MVAMQVVAQQPASMDLNQLNGANGFRMAGEQTGDWLGFAVDGAGDVNNDGLDDFIVSALFNGETGEDAGAAYVVFGQAGGLPADVDLAVLDGSDGFVIFSEEAEDKFGYSVSAVGDINNDGVADLAICAEDAASPGLVTNGITYVLFGRSNFTAVVGMSSFDGGRGFTILGKFAGDRASSVSAAGDFNRDGVDDLIVGTQAHDPGATNAGAAYVVFGHSGMFPPALDLGDIDGDNGVAFWGETAGDIAGYKVAGVGDINADGRDDVAVAAVKESTQGSFAGAVYVVYGQRQNWPAAIELSSLDGTNGFKVTGEAQDNYLGVSLAGLGDFNADGTDDWLMTAQPRTLNPTQVHWHHYVVFGSATKQPAVQSVNQLADLNILTTPTDPDSPYEIQANGIGDFNADGVVDLAVGDPFNNTAGNHAGALYVVYGQASFPQTTLQTDQLTTEQGFQLLGPAWNDSLGRAMAAAGDVNGDGVDDLLMGTFFADPNGSNSGAAYVLYGNDQIFSSQF